MKPVGLKMKYVLSLVVAGFLVTGPVFADKPGNDKGGKGGKNERVERNDGNNKNKGGKDKQAGRGDDHGVSSGKHGRFEDRQQSIVRSYYGEEFRGGRCPPGLAKKNNGCMPPGQAKKWQMGRPLARDVVYYDVPRPLVLKIGAPPSGHKYVRVASDILMIAIGTGMVVDAIQDLGRV